MSNLGKVYELDIAKKVKNSYPVVYENKTRIYCKKHGTDELVYYYKPNSNINPHRTVIDYSVFKARYEEGSIKESSVYYVYIPSHVKTFFEWIKEKTPLEKELMMMKMDLDSTRRAWTVACDTIDRYTKEADRCKYRVRDLTKHIKELENKLSNSTENSRQEESNDTNKNG